MKYNVVMDMSEDQLNIICDYETKYDNKSRNKVAYNTLGYSLLTAYDMLISPEPDALYKHLVHSDARKFTSKTFNELELKYSFHSGSYKSFILFLGTNNKSTSKTYWQYLLKLMNAFRVDYACGIESKNMMKFDNYAVNKTMGLNAAMIFFNKILGETLNDFGLNFEKYVNFVIDANEKYEDMYKKYTDLNPLTEQEQQRRRYYHENPDTFINTERGSFISTSDWCYSTWGRNIFMNMCALNAFKDIDKNIRWKSRLKKICHGLKNCSYQGFSEIMLELFDPDISGLDIDKEFSMEIHKQFVKRNL